MKYDTIELNAELGTQPGYSAMLFSYGIKINGVEFHPEHSLDLTSLVKSCQWSGPVDIFTCSCGEPGCAGIFHGVEVRHSHSEITWKCPDPISVSEDTPDLWEHGVTTFEHLSFDPEQYIHAIDSGIRKIKSLAILSTSPFEFPVHGVEFDQVMSLETQPFSSHNIEPERRILARQVVVNAYYASITVDGVSYQICDLNLDPELLKEYSDWRSTCVFPSEASEIVAYTTYLQRGRAFCRALRKFIGRRTAVSFTYRPPSFYNKEAWEVIEVIR